MSTDHINLDKLVRRIVLDVSLLRWFAINGGRGLAVASAVVLARRTATPLEGKILDFLEQHVGDEPFDDEPPAAA